MAGDDVPAGGVEEGNRVGLRARRPFDSAQGKLSEQPAEPRRYNPSRWAGHFSRILDADRGRRPSNRRPSPICFRSPGKTTTVKGQTRKSSQKSKKWTPPFPSLTCKTFPRTQRVAPMCFWA